MLDELTDGHALTDHEVQTLIELEDSIFSYDKECRQLKAFTMAMGLKTTPVQLLKDMMAKLQLSASDLPEIVDMTVV